MSEEKETKLAVQVVGIEEMVKKAEMLNELLKEAKTLADELASVEFEITSSVEN